MIVELLPLIGEMMTKTGPQQIQWGGIERLILNNREVAKIKTAPGAAVSLFPHVRINAAEKQAIIDHITKVRGVPPAAIHATCELYEILKLAEGDDDEDKELSDDE